MELIKHYVLRFGRITVSDNHKELERKKSQTSDFILYRIIFYTVQYHTKYAVWSTELYPSLVEFSVTFLL